MRPDAHRSGIVPDIAAPFLTKGPIRHRFQGLDRVSCMNVGSTLQAGNLPAISRGLSDSDTPGDRRGDKHPGRVPDHDPIDGSATPSGVVALVGPRYPGVSSLRSSPPG